MLGQLPKESLKLIINTGNILNLNEIKKLTGHNQSDEVVESIKITITNQEDLKSVNNSYYIARKESAAEPIDRDLLKISAKIFGLSAKPEVVRDALDHVFETLKITTLDSLILAFKLEPSSVLSSLRELWSVVEEYVAEKKLVDVGLSDIDTDVFIALHSWAKVKPRIIQINLAVCCVVPPVLQEFCKSNNIQLLTHSDPLDIVPKAALYQTLSACGNEQLSVEWVARYLLHIQCRGVLHSKGYLVSINRQIQ